MADDEYLNFLKSPDQESRRAELRAFIGPNADIYLKAYDKLVVNANRKPGESGKFAFLSTGTAAAAFFTGPVWYFYRKLWLWGAAIVGVMTIIAFIPTSRLGLPVSLAIAMAARPLYLNHAIRTIIALRAKSSVSGLVPSSSNVLALNPAIVTGSGQVVTPGTAFNPFFELLREAGGVSTAAGWIGGILYAILVGLAIFGAIDAISTGQMPPI